LLCTCRKWQSRKACAFWLPAYLTPKVDDPHRLAEGRRSDVACPFDQGFSTSLIWAAVRVGQGQASRAQARPEYRTAQPSLVGDKAACCILGKLGCRKDSALPGCQVGIDR
jgi:hypothetical protein